METLPDAPFPAILKHCLLTDNSPFAVDAKNKVKQAVTGKAPEIKGQAAGKAEELKGQAAGKAEELKGKAKGKVNEL